MKHIFTKIPKAPVLTLAVLFILAFSSCSWLNNGTDTEKDGVTAVSTAAVSSVSRTSLTLTWTKPDGVSKVKIYKSTSESPSSSESNLLTTSSSTSYTVTGLSESTKYYFDLVSVDSSGNTSSAYSLNATTKDPINDSNLESLSAQDLTVLMGNGINLGNTFDAYGTSWLGYNASVSSYEQCWGQLLTTEDMIKAYKAGGFDSVRIPVSWTNTMDWANNDFTISDDYLKRVKEVVDWALDAGLYVILNDHHDGEWQSTFGSDEELAFKIYDAIWKQVGEYFIDEPLQLIFEGGNEQFGDVLNCGSTEANYTMTNKINQHFVDFIRAQGGNNEKRFLLLPGYNTDITATVNASYEMPDDSANSVNKLLVSVHYYTPSSYAITKVLNKWGSKSQYTELLGLFEDLSALVDEGYGVIIGEYAASKDYNSAKKDGMENWIKAILDLSDYYNYCPVMWECSDFFNKDSSKGDLGWTLYPEVGALYTSRNYEAQGEVTGKTGLETVTSAKNAAPECIFDTTYSTSQTSKAVAFLGYADSSWSVNTAANGTTWNPDIQMSGIEFTNQEFTSAETGTFTVSIDVSKSSFDDDGNASGSASGCSVMYLSITNGGSILSGKTVTVTKLEADSTEITLSSNPSAAASGSGDLQINILNSWVSPAAACFTAGDISSAEKITVTFTVE